MRRGQSIRPNLVTCSVQTEEGEEGLTLDEKLKRVDLKYMQEMTAEKGTIELVSGMGQSADFLREVQIGIEKIQSLSGFKVNLVADFIPKAQQLCV